MNAARVRFAIEALRAIPANGKFDMGDWGYHFDHEHTPEEKNYCGTHACAFGWIAIHPKAKALGLDHKWDGYSLQFRYDGDAEEFAKRGLSRTLSRTWTRWNAYEIAATWLDIRYEDATDLFSPESYDRNTPNITADDVIERLEQLLQEAA